MKQWQFTSAQTWRLCLILMSMFLGILPVANAEVETHKISSGQILIPILFLGSLLVINVVLKKRCKGRLIPDEYKTVVLDVVNLPGKKDIVTLRCFDTIKILVLTDHAISILKEIPIKKINAEVG